MLADDRRIDRPDRPGVELLPGVPTDLNRMLVAGDIDLGPVSSIAYARNHRRLLLSRRLSISSFGAVDSIQLVSRRPLEQIRTRGPHHAERHLGGAAQDHPQAAVPAGRRLLASWPAPVEPALEEHDAVLLIGDQGLEALYFPTPGHHLPRPGRALAGVDRAAHGLRGLGRPRGFRPDQRRRTAGRGRGTRPLHGLRPRPPVRGGRVGRWAGIASTGRASRATSRVCATTSPRSTRKGCAFYELAHEAGELEEVPRAAVHRRGGGRRGGEAPAGRRRRRAERRRGARRRTGGRLMTRMTDSEALELLRSRDLLGVGARAHEVRERLVPGAAGHLHHRPQHQLHQRLRLRLPLLRLPLQAGRRRGLRALHGGDPRRRSRRPSTWAAPPS